MSSKFTPANPWLVPDGVYALTVLGGTTGSPQIAQTCADNPNGGPGGCPIPARLDHSHPLNLADVLVSGATGQTGTYVKPVGAEAKHGTSPFYARVDHVHTMPTGNNTYVPASTWSLISGNSDTTTYSAVLKTNTWTRGSTKIDNKPAGFKCEILTRCIRPNVSGSAGPKDVFIFREFTFDENGCVKAVSAEKYAFSEWNGLKKPV